MARHGHEEDRTAIGLTNCRLSGASLTLQYVAGHDNIRITMRYVNTGVCGSQAVCAAVGLTATGGAHRVQEDIDYR